MFSLDLEKLLFLSPNGNGVETKFMKCKDWNKSESDSWLIYQSGSRGQGGAGEQVNDWEEWDPLGAFPFISEVSSSNVVSVTLLSFFFSPFLKFIQHSLLVLTGQPNQYCCQATSVSPESECINSSVAVSSSRPQFSLFLSGVCFPGLYTQGQVEWSSKSLCAPQHPDFFLS